MGPPAEAPGPRRDTAHSTEEEIASMRVYRYGAKLRGPLDPVAEEQVELANRFWNELVDMHRKYGELLQKAQEEASPALAALRAEMAALAEEKIRLRGLIKKSRQKARGNVPADPAIKEQLRAVSQRIKELKPIVKMEKEKAKTASSDERHRLSEQQKLEKKRLRQKYAALGLYWSNYNAVLQGFDTAVKRELETQGRLRVRKHAPSGAAVWTVRIQHPTGAREYTWADATRGDPSKPFSIIMPDSEREEFTTHDGRTLSRRRLPVARLRVRAERAKTPDGTWVEFGGHHIDVPFYMHRQPPPTARVVMARLVRKRIADCYEYHLCITVDEPPAPKRSGTAAGVDLGWRRLPDGAVRVAYVAGEDGAKGALAVPQSTLDRLAHAERLQGIRDSALEGIRSDFVAWAKPLLGNPALPDFVAAALAGDREHGIPPLASWRSPRRFARLTGQLVRWAADHPNQAAALPDWPAWNRRIQSWNRQDKPLWRTLSFLRVKAIAHRNEQYRIFAKRLAERYAYIVLEDMDIQDMNRKPQAEQAPETSQQKLRHLARAAAPAAVRSAIENASWRWGSTFVKVDPANTTRRHAPCGNLVEQNYAESVMVYCPECKVWYDQDENAAVNLLLRIRENPPPAPTNPKPANGSRWQRAKAKAR